MAMNRALRWVLVSLGGLVALVVVAAGALYAISGQRLGAKHDVPAEQALVIPTDSASVARGERLVAELPCAQCHGADLGGNVFADATSS